MASRKQAKAPSSPIILMILGSVIILAVVIWQTSRVLDAVAPAIAPTSADAGFIPYSDIERISLEDAKKAYDAGTVVILDIRDADSYAYSHITGAINIDLEVLESRLVELNRSDHIITYCT